LTASWLWRLSSTLSRPYNSKVPGTLESTISRQFDLPRHPVFSRTRRITIPRLIGRQCPSLFSGNSSEFFFLLAGSYGYLKIEFIDKLNWILTNLCFYDQSYMHPWLSVRTQTHYWALSWDVYTITRKIVIFIQNDIHATPVNNRRISKWK
jgi:hypothetical protein